MHDPKHCWLRTERPRHPPSTPAAHKPTSPYGAEREPRVQPPGSLHELLSPNISPTLGITSCTQRVPSHLTIRIATY
eukprot:10169916-Alexandrium_andersonii.AAC.2